MKLKRGDWLLLGLTGAVLLLEGTWAVWGQEPGSYRAAPERGKLWTEQAQTTHRPVIWVESTPSPEPTPSQPSIEILLPGETPPAEKPPEIQIIFPGETPVAEKERGKG